MSTQSLNDFTKAINEDADLRSKLIAIQNEISDEEFAPRLAAMAAEYGHNVTVEEVVANFSRERSENTEISDEELEHVAGGYTVCYNTPAGRVCHFK